MQASFSLAHVLTDSGASLIAVMENAADNSPIPTVLAELAVRGEPCGVIVANNRLNVYAIGESAERIGGHRDAALQQILIVRAETCRQLHSCLQRLAAQPPSFRFLFVLGMLEPFYDEDIRFARAEWLLNDALRHMRRLSAQGVHLVATLASPPTPSPREKFLLQVQQRADVLIQPKISVLEIPIQPQLEM